MSGPSVTASVSIAPFNQSAGFDTEVAIIGYGPSGVSAANFLGALGVSAIAFERDREIYQRARAVTVNDWTLRCYQSVGLDGELVRDMDASTIRRWRTYDGKELLRSTSPPSTLGQPASSMIYQPVMEQTLRRGAERYADLVEVRFGQLVGEVTQDDDGVTVTTTDEQTGATRRTRARYALACDGGSSGVRTQLGVKLLGSTVDTRWVVIDAKVKRWWPERHLSTFWSDPRRPVVDIPLALGNHRWEFPLEPQESESDFATKEQLWPLLKAMGVTPDDVEIHQHAFYKHHVRNAERWRVGRVFLLGDAAHLMPPWAGQGMQSGIRDAHNIAWKLHQVLRGRLPDSLLDSFEVERAPHVAMCTAVAERIGRVIKMQMTPKEKRAALIGRVLGRLGFPRPPSPLAMPPSLKAGWLQGKPGPTGALGQMIPQPRVATIQGKQMPLDAALGQGFVILGDETDPAGLLSPSDKAAWDALGARYIAVRSGTQASQGSDELIDLEDVLLRWMRERGTSVIAVRPDRFVVATQSSGLAPPPLQ